MNEQSAAVAISGIRFYQPPPTAVLSGRDGKVQIPYGDLPIPLLEEDFTLLGGGEPSCDAVGRGIYQALRTDPDIPHAARYAAILQEGYPHLIAELASHLLMLEKREVEVGYLDRKVNCLKIFALLEPDNHRFPLEIGATLLEKGLRLAAMNQTTVILYRAEAFLGRAVAMKPDDPQACHLLGEVRFLLGRYGEAARLWEGVLPAIVAGERQRLERRLEKIAAGELPRVPAVDYLQAIGVAMEAFATGDYEETAAILHDVMDDVAFFEELPLAEINYLLGLSYARQDIPRYAEEYLRQALALRPDYPEAQQALAELTG